MKRLKLEEIVKRLKIQRPSTVEDLLVKCKLPLQLIDYGQFRRVYKVLGTPYVVKVPKIAWSKTDIGHSRREISALKLLNKAKYAVIHPYLLTFYYTNRNTGVILTDECKWSSYAKNFDTMKEIGEWAEDTGFFDADVHTDKSDNYGMLNGQLKILDLGCFVNGDSGC